MSLAAQNCKFALLNVKSFGIIMQHFSTSSSVAIKKKRFFDITLQTSFKNEAFLLRFKTLNCSLRFRLEKIVQESCQCEYR